MANLKSNPDKNHILCLSYFDNIMGPTIFYCSSPVIPGEHPNIGKILEFQDQEGSFIFAHRKYQTINYVFYIDSEYARGGKDLLMITYMIRAAFYRDEITDIYNYLQSIAIDLKEFAEELKTIKDFPKILHERKYHPDKQNIITEAPEEFKKDFLTVFNKYFNKISPRIPPTMPLQVEKNIKKIHVIGPKGSGKSSLISNLEIFQFLQYKDPNQKRDLVNKIIDFIIENIEIVNYENLNGDINGGLLSLYQECIDNSQAILLVFDVSNKENVKEIKELIGLISNRCSLRENYIPILIIGNKINNMEDLNAKGVKKYLKIKNLRKQGLKINYLPINILIEEKKLISALKWLIKEMI
ncbi:MAG: GTPase domain-containing protein [Promethearchaeota archaeon]